MRTLDLAKRDAIIEATIILVNDIGFEATTVSKISKIAGMSVGSLYLYFKNKEDIIISTYLHIKEKMSESIFEDHHSTMPFRESLFQIWRNMFSYVETNKCEFCFAEKFTNSHYRKLVDTKEVADFFSPLLQVLNEGVEQRLIKDMNSDFLGAFMFYPIRIITTSDFSGNIELNRDNVEAVYQLTWDAIRA